MSTRWAGGSTRAWRRVRAAVLARDGWCCRAHTDGWCAKKPGEHTCTGTGTQAHHTHGRAVTGDDPRFIVASCRACNLHIGDPTQTKRSTPDPAGRAMTKW